MAVSDFFIWGQGGAKKTAEDIAREREMANTILQRAGDTSPVGHWTQGAARLVDALGGVVKQRRADAAETELKDYQGGVRSKLAELLSGGSSTPSSIPMTSAAGEVAATSPSVQPIDLSGNEVYSQFINTVREGGLTNPFGLAALAATGKAESSFSPGNVNRTWSDPSQSGQPGTAGGILSWRGPRYEALAATGDLSPAGQARFFLQEDPALIQALNNAKSIEEAQSLINNAWKFAGYDQAGGETARRLSLARSFLPTFQGSGEVAAATPEAAIEAVAPASGYVDPMVIAPNYDPVAANQPVVAATDAVAPLDPPIEVPAAPAVAPVEVSSGGGRPYGINPAIIEALTDPRVDEGTRRLAAILVEQQQAREASSLEEQNWRARQQYEQELLAQDPLRQAQIQKLQREAATGGETFFGNAVPYKDAEGNIRMGQLGNRGTFRPVPLEEGASFAPTTRSVNTGTEMLTVGPGGEILDRVPIQNREAAAEKAAGTVQGQTMAEREMAAPAEIQTGENALSLINDIRNDPYLERGTGFSSYGNIVRGTGGYDFANKVEQAKSGAFLTAIQQMKGLGALSNAEGQAATAAITRMDTATSKEGFLAALDDYEKIVRQAIDRAQGRMSPRSAAPRQPVSIGGYTIEEVD